MCYPKLEQKGFWLKNILRSSLTRCLFGEHRASRKGDLLQIEEVWDMTDGLAHLGIFEKEDL
jgi:hypothetical protein